MIIYKIANNLNGKVYVGQTVRTLEKRIDQHRRRLEHAIGNAIKKYGWENFSAEVLEECETQEELDEREMYWIAKLDCIAPNGYNLNEGGSGGRTPSADTLKRMSEAQKKHYEDPEAHRKLSVAQRKRFADPAEHEKLSRAQKKYFSDPEARRRNSESKKNPSAETRANLSAGQKRRWADEEARAERAEMTRKYFEEHPEAREHLAQMNRGKKHSTESRAKVSASQKGRLCSQETRAKISAAHKARWAAKSAEERKLSAETRAKISASLKERLVDTSAEERKLPEETKAKISATLKERWKKIYKERDRRNFLMKIFDDLKEAFKAKFGAAETQKYFSPGRVNVLGEHIDYSNGFVFPCALTIGTYALVAPRTDNKTRVFSMNLADKGVIEFEMSGLKYNSAYDWANYVAGTIATLEQAGHKATNGFDIVIYGTLPAGAGLSSSASLEVLTAVILNENFNFGLDMVEMVKLSQKAENEFVGVNCGIMDQFAVGMGKKDCAILLDCSTLKYRYSPLKLDGCSLVITNTNKPHSLVTSAYNERRQQCEHALAQLQQAKPELKALCALTKEEFAELKQYITDPIEQLRAQHAVEENQRTLDAVDALEKNDLKKFGELMKGSHVSLCEKYDVTGVELDTLAELAWKVDGCIGSRMTGAGFGGSTISIVQDDAIEEFKRYLENGYTKKIGYAPSFYVAGVADGTHRVKD